MEVLIIISDWLMPEMKGDEFLITVHQKFPHIIKVLLTGQDEEQAIQREKTEANLFSCLCKPWNTQELIDTIQSGIGRL